MHVSNTDRQVSRPLGSEYCLDHNRGSLHIMHIPEGEQNKVSHNQANQPERRKVYVPVPRIAGLALEASQERIVNNSCCSVLYKGADIQQIPPVCNQKSIKSYSLGCNHSPVRQGAAVASANHIACLLLADEWLSASI